MGPYTKAACGMLSPSQQPAGDEAAAEPQHGAAAVRPRPRPWRLLSARVALRTQPAHPRVQGVGDMGHESLNT